MKQDQKIILGILGLLGAGAGITGLLSIFSNDVKDDDHVCSIAKKDEVNENGLVYPERTKKLHELLNDAEDNYRNGKYRYALFDARLVFENALKLFVEMNNCEAMDDTIVKYLSACEYNDLIDDEFINKLHTARKTCNCNSHEIDCKNKVNQNKTNYAIIQIKALLKIIDEKLSNYNEEVLVNA